MKTKATELLPEIEWEDLQEELLESDPEERMKVYKTTGVDSKGNTYTGSAYFFSDELDEIRDIELLAALPQQPQNNYWQLCPKCNGDGNLARYNSPSIISTDASLRCDVCNGSKVLACPQQPVENGFIEYMRETRDQFSKYINGLEWNAPLRTQCESLLICFDQMRERLLTPQQPESAGLRWVKVASDAWDAATEFARNHYDRIYGSDEPLSKEEYLKTIKEKL